MSHHVHGVEWFEARGEVWRGWVWELADRRARVKAWMEQVALKLAEAPEMKPFLEDPIFTYSLSGFGHKVAIRRKP